MTYPRFNPMNLDLTPFLFYTGKGGVGKTSTACAAAVNLADSGKRVLIVSTDPASNLQDVFEQEIQTDITDIEKVPGLFAININPEEIAEQYREKVVGPYRGLLPESAINQMEEQLSGACTVEIAAFDEFAGLLTTEKLENEYDHIIFDTAPTGHTLRLLQLPAAWSGFLEESTHGASCLGPLAGLEEKKALYKAAVHALSDYEKTMLLLVSRPDYSSLTEAVRAAKELKETGLSNQHAIINGVYTPADIEDETAQAFYQKQQEALKETESLFGERPVYQLPYVPYSLTGIDSLRWFFSEKADVTPLEEVSQTDLPGLEGFITHLSSKSAGVVMTMGKGGVGKTTVAATIAMKLASQGHRVHLTTTDPASHLSMFIKENDLSENLSISSIDPQAEVQKYRSEVLAQSKDQLDEEGMDFLKEDLMSPCTEEIAVFRAFAKVVARAEGEFVIIDTAPTGHTLLLLDASESYNQELERTAGQVPEEVKKLLPRLRDPEQTDIVVITLPEATPVLEASRLQEDLKRAELFPSWWVLNQSLSAAHTEDPILKAKGLVEQKWIERVKSKEAEQVCLLPWKSDSLLSVRTK
ncbi:arsenical pump-driving ATPase [Thalassorhabdus alkalitolerans]|uniref:Arsenical pump-driving ATPase n=1 Tax=Thalassorhabdus alkalitolerans TaxID=2282697 RepID=A0ABW0YNF9_9BACI